MQKSLMFYPGLGCALRHTRETRLSSVQYC
jgi:hypothetical protein